MTSRQIILSVLLFVLALLALVLFLFPGESTFGFYLARGLLLFGAVAALLILWYTEKRPSKQVIKTGEEPKNVAQQVPPGDLNDQYEELLDTVFSGFQSLNPDYNSAVYMFDPARRGFTAQRTTSDIFTEFIPTDSAIIKRLFKQTDTIILQQKDVRADWGTIFTDQTWRGSECVLGTPVIYKEAPVGCILLEIDHFSKVQERDRDILTSLGRIFSFGMRKLDQIEKLQANQYYCDRISNLYEELRITNSEQDVFTVLRGLCRSFFSYDKLTLSLLAPSSDQAVVKLVDGYREDVDEGEVFPVQSTLHGRPIRKGHPIRSQYWDQDFKDAGRFHPGDATGHNFMSIVAVPLRINGEISGSLALERMKSRIFSDSDLHLLQLLASTVGSVLTWIYAYQKIHARALHDGLTGLLNHRAFMQRFEEEINRAVRFQQHLVLVVYDLDKFKRVNDNYGHLYGDYVIKTVANLIKTSVRNIDVVARYGGEEFVVILVNSNKELSLPIAKRITKRIADHRYRKDGTEIRMTISAGVAEFPVDADQVKGLIEKADSAMYRQKELGGNGVSVYQSSTIPSGQ
jgi:diguanylate cyclase (GGDEF)-like protein